MHTALLAVNQSTLGWLPYVNNPGVMSRFNLEDLNGIQSALNEIAETYILHDVEVTEKVIQKGLSPSNTTRSPHSSWFRRRSLSRRLGRTRIPRRKPARRRGPASFS